MKLIHKYLILGVAAAGAFTACDNYDADDHKFDNVVYLDVSKTDEVQPATFSNNTPTVEKPIQATLAYPEGQDVAVSLTVDPSLVATYNARYGSDWKMLDAKYYELSSDNVTIHAGKTASEVVTLRLKGLMGEGEQQTGALPIDETLRKPCVGIVGEILVKYMPVANNHLVDLLEEEGAEAVVPDLMDFMNYSVYNGKFKHEYLGKGWTSEASAVLGVKGIRALRRPALKALEKSKRFEPPMHIEQIAELSDPFLSQGNQYGEGWFLTGEMAELLLTGVPNIVCIQPFACLPNHVVGKGVIKQLRKKYPQANICAVDFDPGASEVNQLNRVKLMLSAARKNLGQEAK